MSRKLFGSHDLLLNSWDCLKQSTNPSVMSGNISHVTRKVVLTDQESAPPAPPPKMRRRLSGKTAPHRCGGQLRSLAAATCPGLLRRGHQPQPSPRLTLQGPPLQKAVVEAVSYIESQRGFPLWVPYAWNVRNPGARAYSCSVCRQVGLQRQHIVVQQCDITTHVQKDSTGRGAICLGFVNECEKQL
jgi:hypothetical protein